MSTVSEQRLFPAELPESEWCEFSAKGYNSPVCGIVYTSDNPPSNGIPLGGIDTGCIDIEGDGTFGLTSIFNSHVPRRGPLNLPFLGVAIDGKVHILSTRALDSVRFNEPWVKRRDFVKTLSARSIGYWGHYPILDMEYDLNTPLSIGVRSWVPFLPGDAAASNTPGAVFDVYVRNNSDEEKGGRLAFSFPGPASYEAEMPKSYKRKLHDVELKGVTVTNGANIGYTLVVRGGEDVHAGPCFGVDTSLWASLLSGLVGSAEGQSAMHGWVIPHRIPEAGPTDAGSTVAVDFSLKPGESTSIRFILTWYSPVWYAGGRPNAEGKTYSHMYSTRFKDSEDVARFLHTEGDTILRKIIAWQEVVYAEKKLPGWLRDSLINTLHCITEDSLWGAAKPPMGDWCRKEDGLFGMLEDPRCCPQIECVPNSFYGTLPIVYLFPDLALSTLRGHKAYQFDDGAPAWVFGGPTSDLTLPPWAWIGKGPTGTEPCEFTTPARGYQFATNGISLVGMIDRLIMRTGSDKLLREFYPAVKKATIYTMNLRPEYGPKQIVSMPTDNEGSEWFEFCDWFGMATHVGGLHLAQLKISERMAKKMGDEEFAEQCRTWFDEGSDVLEKEMWTGNYYLLYNEPETGKKSDLVFGYTLDGEWIARQHGFAGAFPAERVKTTLETIKKTCIETTNYGALIYAEPDGTFANGDKIDASYFTPVGIHLPSTLTLAVTYMYKGERDYGLDLAYKAMHNFSCRHRSTWDAFLFYRGDTGEPVYGDDYWQGMIIWSLPAALEGKDLSAPVQGGGLVDRILKAAK